MHSSTFADSKMYPFLPFSTKFEKQPAFVLTKTALPHAIASLTTSPHVSPGPCDGSARISWEGEIVYKGLNTYDISGNLKRK